MDPSQFVRGYLYPFLWDVVHAVGGSDGDVNNVYSFVAGLIYGDFGWLFTPLLFPPIALWFYAKNALGAVQADLQGGLAWLQSKITEAEGWLLGILYQVRDWLLDRITDAENWLLGVLYQVRDWLLDRITDAENWVHDRLVDVQNWVHDRLVDVQNWLHDRWTDFQNWVHDRLTDVQNWLHDRLLDAENWLHDRITDFQNWLHDFTADLRSQLEPLFDFLRWWKSGKGDLIVKFADDPVGTMLDLLAPKFIGWLAQLIADNW